MFGFTPFALGASFFALGGVSLGIPINTTYRNSSDIFPSLTNITRHHEAPCVTGIDKRDNMPTADAVEWHSKEFDSIFYIRNIAHWNAENDNGEAVLDLFSNLLLRLGDSFVGFAWGNQWTDPANGAFAIATVHNINKVKHIETAICEAGGPCSLVIGHGQPFDVPGAPVIPRPYRQHGNRRFDLRHLAAAFPRPFHFYKERVDSSRDAISHLRASGEVNFHEFFLGDICVSRDGKGDGLGDGCGLSTCPSFPPEGEEGLCLPH